MKRLLVILALLGSGCASPLAPQQEHAVILSGQSNAILMQPFLVEAITTYTGGSKSGTPIACWAADGECWQGLKPVLIEHPNAAAFVWWQGESDMDNTNYEVEFADLITRVRSLTRSDLPVIATVEFGPVFSPGIPGSAEDALRHWTATDHYAAPVLTRSLGYEFRLDRAHMTDLGYHQVVGEIIGIIGRAK